VIRIVLDNLNTHRPASLYEAFAPEEARRILRRLEFHYTPKHGSWLNMAEIELSVLNGQCLDRRIGEEKQLKREVQAWQDARNAAQAKIDWRFSCQEARAKLSRLYPASSAWLTNRFAKNHAGLAEGKPFINGPRTRPWSITYRGQPFFVSEFGVIWWKTENRSRRSTWGYGKRPKTIEEFYERFQGLCDVLLDHAHMFGYCYTQLTDTYQEQNGLYTFDRRPKFDLDRLRRIQQRPAAIEKTQTK
jgi:hypothetical protein